jgi:hypothetical protein
MLLDLLIQGSSIYILKGGGGIIHNIERHKILCLYGNNKILSGSVAQRFGLSAI